MSYYLDDDEVAKKWDTAKVKAETSGNKTAVAATIGNAFMNKAYYYICPTCGEAWLDSGGEYATNGSIVYVVQKLQKRTKVQKHFSGTGIIKLRPQTKAQLIQNCL